ncbi:hypothetical protein ACWCZ5_34365 [Streptomyces sp. NPDC001667]
MERRNSTLIRLVIAAVAALGLALTGQFPAHAATGDLTCTAQAQVNFSPPLVAGGTSTGDVDAVLDNCTSPNGSFSRLTSAEALGSATVSAAPGVNPCSLRLTLNATLKATWQNGQHSDIAAELTTDPTLGTAGLTATVTGGQLAGDSITPVIVEINPNPDCATNGLKSLTTTTAQAIFG